MGSSSGSGLHLVLVVLIVLLLLLLLLWRMHNMGRRRRGPAERGDEALSVHCLSVGGVDARRRGVGTRDVKVHFILSVACLRTFSLCFSCLVLHTCVAVYCTVLY